MYKLGLFGLTAMLAVIVIGQYHQVTARVLHDRTDYVQNICDVAHDENSGRSEQVCGWAQDHANAEYLCDGRSPSAHCWVELK